MKLKFENPLPVSQQTHCFTRTNTNLLMLFRRTITVYCKDHRSI